VDVGTDARSIDFDGRRLAYRVSGQGPALVVLAQYRQPADAVRVRMLGDRCTIFHITPVGYGESDRAPGYAGAALPEQVLAVLDRHQVSRFVVWGYSAGGAMAACVARATPRAAGLVCGGFCPVDAMTPGTIRRLDRRLRPDHPSRSLWWWYNTIDWGSELGSMPCARLLYWGSQDRQMARRLRSAQLELSLRDVEFIELAGLDHTGCNTKEALAQTVIPTVADWLSRRLEPWS
jgi:pimeloyl-ACP methyl ester carboxylesterase